MDVLVLGEAQPRGAVVKARVIGVLKLLDGGEIDDKILAVLQTSALASVGTPEEMDTKFPGVLSIVRTWFESYQGPSELTSKGYAGPSDAMKVISSAKASFEK
ncbi:MAG: inorganic diphosphatase [Rhodospirillaceae bacterium]